MITLHEQERTLFSFLRTIAQQHGVTVRVSGGWVRDKCLNYDSASPDIDLAIEGMSGREFAEIVRKAQGRGHVSVIEARPEQSKHLETAMLDVHGFSIDFVGLRKESYTDNSRIPTIEQGTIVEDASRRDLTVNSMYYDIHNDMIEDYFDGQSDLKNRIARTPIDSLQTFLDDPLRILRTIRFCVKYHLEPSSEIIAAAHHPEVQASFKQKISKERIWKEMIGTEDKPGFLLLSCESMSRVREFGFMELLFSPENIKLNPWPTDQNSPHHDLNIQDHTIRAFEELFINLSVRYKELPHAEKAIVLLSMVLHDLGKRDPDFIQVHEQGHFQYKGHDSRSTILSEIVLNQLGAPNNIKERTVRMVDNHMRYHVIKDDCRDKVLRKIVKDMGEDWYLLVEHCLADAYGKINVAENQADRYFSFMERTKTLISQQGNSVVIKRPVSGYDLMDLGVKGPVLGVLFKALDEQLLDYPDMTKEQAIEFLSEYKTANSL